MKYALTKNNIEVKKLEQITEGCTISQDWQMPEAIRIFDNSSEAIEKLREYNSSIEKIGTVYDFTEFYIQEVSLDEDDNVYELFDVIEFSKIIINAELIRNWNYEDGKKTLETVGYIQTSSATEEQSVNCDYIIDYYFEQIGEDGDTIHTISFVQYFDKNNDESNDDGASDYLIKENWEEVY